LVLEELLQVGFIASLLAATIRLSTPLIFASMGEVVVERSGAINLGVEGMMLIGAFAGFMVADFSKDVGLGLLASIAIGVILGILLGALIINLGLNQLLSGLGIYYFGLGLSSYAYKAVYGEARVAPHIKGFSTAPLPLLSSIPVLGKILFSHDVLVYAALILVVVVHYILFKTSWGLKIRASGENPKAAYALGINVNMVRFLSVIFGATLASVSGAYIALAQVKIFQEWMTAGKGFIALGIVCFGNWKPSRTLLGALIFGGLEALQLRLQAIGIPLPTQFFNMLPYIMIIIVMIIASRKAVAPAALGIPFKK